MDVAIWTAIGTCATPVVALAAVVATVPPYRQNKQAAKNQIEESRRLTREESRPYIIVSMEFGPVAPAHMVQLVIRNHGKTVARDVRLTSEPSLQRATELRLGDREVFVPEVFPTLVPGQTWATMWDMGYDRKPSELPDRHEVTVQYLDGGGTTYTDDYVLDWTTVWDQRQMPPKTTHDAALALTEIQKTLQAWSEGPYGLRVWQRSGEDKDRQEEERYEALQEAARAQAKKRQAAGIQRPDLELMTEQLLNEKVHAEEANEVEPAMGRSCPSWVFHLVSWVRQPVARHLPWIDATLSK